MLSLKDLSRGGCQIPSRKSLAMTSGLWLLDEIKATNLIIVIPRKSNLCDHLMLDPTSVLIPILGGAGLAVMITVFLKRRKSVSSTPSQNDSQKSSVIQQNSVDPKAESSSGPFPSPSVDEVEKAREELKALDLQRQIVTAALTSVFEAETRGRISRGSRDSLVETYKTQLKALDEQIAERKRTTAFSDLLNEKEELEKNFERRMAEISERLKQFDAFGVTLAIPTSDNPQAETVKTTSTQLTSTGNNNGEEKKPAEKTKNRTEERIQAIREEVLKAIERLEKIESEG
jgi:hypothetical protein